MVYVSLAELISVTAISIVVSAATVKFTLWKMRRKYRRAFKELNYSTEHVEYIESIANRR